MLMYARTSYAKLQLPTSWSRLPSARTDNSSRAVTPKEAVKDFTISQPTLSVGFLVPLYRPPCVNARGLELAGILAIIS